MAGGLGFAIRRHWNRHEAERLLHEKETGFPDQL
jgi:hypothetical protein